MIVFRRANQAPSIGHAHCASSHRRRRGRWPHPLRGGCRYARAAVFPAQDDARALGDGYAVHARIHPREREAVRALAQEPVGRVDLDAEPGAGPVMVDDVEQGRRQRGSEVEVGGPLDMATDRV